MRNLKAWTTALFIGGALGVTLIATEADAWIRGGIVIGVPLGVAPYPYYPYPAPYAYPAPPYGYYPPPPAYAYPPAPPQPAYQGYSSNAPGTECREYSRSVIIAGKSQQAYGHACRQPDGKWQITD